MKYLLSVIMLFTAFLSIMADGQAADGGVITCINQECRHDFRPEANKAPMWDAMAAGGVAGATAGAAAGSYVGAGTGVAFGGAGAIPGWIAGGVLGGGFGGVIGGIGGAWYRDRQVMCPRCKTIFDNPKN